MKSSNLWRIIWIVGIYVILIVILYLVILYKVKWEHKDLNTYLYFYDCGRKLCTSTNEINNYYNRILCEDKICPYIDTIIDSNLILNDHNNISWIYNYIDGEIVNDKYNDYRYIGKDMYVVKNDTGKYGIINSDGSLIVDLEYKYIDQFNSGYISYIDENGLYGIKGTYNDNSNININAKYEDVVLINDKIFASKENNIYQIYSYSNIASSISNEYDYVFSYDDVILVVYDGKIDILNSNLKSLLLMKIDTYYKYEIGQERDSLDIYVDDEYIYFKVFISDTEYNAYKYNIKEKKLLND